MADSDAVAIVPIDVPALERVRTLAHAIWPEAFDGILPADRIPGMLAEIYALDTLADDVTLRGHRYWVATVGGADAGYCSAYVEDGRVWIKKLYLSRACRGMGLGKRLIATAIEAFPQAQSVGLYVNDGNRPAIASYQSQGFAIEDHVPVQMGPYAFTDYVMARAIER